jgi:hypothetical protein
MTMSDSASSYALGWIEDRTPRWDSDRAELFATVANDMFPASLRVDSRTLPGNWWRVVDGGPAVAFGWLHDVSDRAVALLAVAESAREGGARGYGAIRLGEEATSRGFDRVVEMRRRTYPGHAAVTVWILESVRITVPGAERQRTPSRRPGRSARSSPERRGWSPG